MKRSATWFPVFYSALLCLPQFSSGYLAARDFLSAGFRAYALFAIYRGYQAAG